MAEPGWYDDPDGTPGRLRYWDGTRWTDEVQPGPTASAAPAAPYAAPAAAPTPVRKRSRVPLVLGVLATLAVLGIVAVVALFAPFGARGGASTEPSAAAPAPVASDSGSPAPGEPVCPAPGSGEVTDGFATMKLPQGWSASLEAPSWANCGSGAYVVVTDDWISQVEIGSVSSGNASHENLARALWDWNVAHGYLNSGTVTPTIAENAAVTIDGVTGWRIRGEIRVSDVEGVAGDVATVVILPRDKGVTTAILTVHTIDDARTTADVASLWESIEVTP